MTRKLAVALRRGRPPVEVAMLDLELQHAAGDSLRRVRRRYPLRERRRRVYAEAAAMLEGRLLEASADGQPGMLLATLDAAARRAEGCGRD